ncbi:MAG TPA: nucleotide exchange factor GrpE [Candidatus Cloacimonetes bacterium]|nr:nucleotide exchange factor GrpE [Candidatus Cloacimonas sp.]HHZ15246.1 nucleotide exchange factor GrpE [Candidatus Cloacimonadota bacterium]
MTKNKKQKDTENGQVDIQTPETELTPEERIAELEIEIAELKDKYIRSMAEFENFRNRSNREKADWIKLSTQKLALKVCDVLDNLERALEQVDEEAKEDKLIKGFVLIEQQLRKVLESENVRKIEALGSEFDPALHEALAHIPSDEEENIITAVIQNGYMSHDVVIRPAKVAVSSGQAIENNNNNNESTLEE